MGQPFHLRRAPAKPSLKPEVSIPPSVTLVLERLDGANDGVGSGTLQLYLRDHGITASQPTVGRILRELDHQGLTTRLSNRGRVLTKAGRKFLELAHFEETRHRWVEEVINTLQPASRDDLLPLLEALRTVECEIAKLAAERATPKQIQEMTAVVDEQRKQLGSRMRGAKEGTDFHQLLAKASANRYLAFAKRMLWGINRSLEDLWYEANIVTGMSSYPAHLRICRAVAAHQSRQACRAMSDHFDDFTRAVEARLKIVSATAHPKQDLEPVGANPKTLPRQRSVVPAKHTA
jgi:GntR family transcriptional repressor for pyruvate dehydrogenase complex